MPSEKLLQGLENFRNSLDDDIEEFIRHRAIDFENRNWCSTYLGLNEDEFFFGRIVLEGYFTLSNKVIELSEQVSRSQRKKMLNGISNNAEYLHVILIGQLGKHIDSEYKSEISMDELLDMAFEIIDSVNELIVCRCVLLECRKADSNALSFGNRTSLHCKYTEYGFVPLQQDEDKIQYLILI